MAQASVKFEGHFRPQAAVAESPLISYVESFDRMKTTSLRTFGFHELKFDRISCRASL